MDSADTNFPLQKSFPWKEKAHSSQNNEIELENLHMHMREREWERERIAKITHWTRRVCPFWYTRTVERMVAYGCKNPTDVLV